jgi:hypothetical protein
MLGIEANHEWLVGRTQPTRFTAEVSALLLGHASGLDRPVNAPGR